MDAQLTTAVIALVVALTQLVYLVISQRSQKAKIADVHQAVEEVKNENGKPPP